MTRCWIKAAGVGWSAGPFTLADLRNLRAAGVLKPEHLASLDAHGGFRPLAGWPELVAALDSPDAKVLPGETAFSFGAYVPPASPDETDSEMPARPSGFRPGNPMFENVNAGDVTPHFSSLDNLAVNRAAEPHKPLPFPPWWRIPWVRNVGRYLAVLGFALLCALAGLQTVALLLVGGGAWFVFVVSPAEWGE